MSEKTTQITQFQGVTIFKLAHIELYAEVQCTKKETKAVFFLILQIEHILPNIVFLDYQ